MIKYGHLGHALSEYLEGEVLLSERQTVVRHLKVCAVCRQELRVLRQTVDALERLPYETTPTDFIDKLRLRIEQLERKSQSVVATAPVAPCPSLAQQEHRRGQFLFFPLPAWMPLYIGIVVLGFATVLLREASEQPTATRIVRTVPAPLPSEVLPQRVSSGVDETIQAAATAESTLEQHLSPVTSRLPPTESLSTGPMLVWRVAGSEPAILRQQVKQLVSQKAEAVVVQEEERLLVISLPSAMLSAVRQELNTLGTENLPEAEIVPHTLTTVVRIEFLRAPSIVAPPTSAQPPGRS